jgi:hypothetical protein
MAKKRKSLATRLDEVDRTMYSTFCSGANSLSQLYAQAMNQQKLSFQAGERHGLEKLYQWILRQQEGGTRVTTGDILGYLQAADVDHYVEDPSLTSSRATQGSSGAPAAGFGTDPNDHQNSKNHVFTDALASPVRLSLQNYHIGSHPNRSNPHDSSMDMHADNH